ncbi:GNAT family N-acetyltransferase [Arthrobacter sp. JZ12]|uniref:GNAT family N-acetyltransferase n=1 Tax=Arthrobacter sp. JZ12 TaxID=2654190 RepID=UPI002B4A934C|nr:GNAT family N-acetyltransferase [Arthrobacter sp. JZ12]
MVTIRPLRIDEIEAALRMKNQGWRQAYRGRISQEVLDGLDDDLEAQAEAWRCGFGDGRDAPLVAIDDDGGIVGIAAAGEPRGDSPPADIELFLLYVLEEYYGTGLGRELAEAVIGQAGALLWVLEGNDRAIAFYRKLGFTEDGVRETLSERWYGLKVMRMVRPGVSNGKA